MSADAYSVRVLERVGEVASADWDALVGEDSSPFVEHRWLEALEETGYKIRAVKPIAKFFASPGGTSETIHLFYAEVANSDKVAAGGGIGNEDIEIRTIPVEQLFDMADAQRIEDPKLLIGALWLRQQLQMHEIL